MSKDKRNFNIMCIICIKAYPFVDFIKVRMLKLGIIILLLFEDFYIRLFDRFGFITIIIIIEMNLLETVMVFVFFFFLYLL